MTDLFGVALLQLIGIVLAGVVTYALGRKKTTAEAKKLNSESIKLLADADRAKAEVTALRDTAAADLTRAASGLIVNFEMVVNALRLRIVVLETNDREKTEQIDRLQNRITELESENANLRKRNREMSGGSGQ